MSAMTSFEKIQQAYLWIKDGNCARARLLLLEVIDQHPVEAEAWVGLSFCADSTAERRRCLERALWIDPGHRYASAALARLQLQTESVQANRLEHVASVGTSIQPPAQGWSLTQLNLALAMIAFILVGWVLIVTMKDSSSTPAVEVTGGQYQFIEFYADW